MNDNTKRTHRGIEHISKNQREKEKRMRGRQGKPEHQRTRTKKMNACTTKINKLHVIYVCMNVMVKF
jgi:hypothetical protein